MFDIIDVDGSDDVTEVGCWMVRFLNQQAWWLSSNEDGELLSSNRVMFHGGFPECSYKAE